MNVSIKEGQNSKQFGQTNYLRTNLYGSGTTDWVPEDERKLTTQRFTENGTYIAQEFKDYQGNPYYGFEEVEVDIETDEVIGYDPDDGNEYQVTVDEETGELVDTVLPSSIVITTQPTKKDYYSGEVIDTTGMVVKAYKEDGSLWEGEGYPGGVIPLSEITLDPTVASPSAGKIEYQTANGFYVGDTYIDGQIFSEDRIGAPLYLPSRPTDAERELHNQMVENAIFAHVSANQTTHEMGIYGDWHVTAFNNVRSAFVIRPVRICLVKTRYTESGYGYAFILAAQSSGSLGAGGSSTTYPDSYTYDGKTVWVTTETCVIGPQGSSQIKTSDYNIGDTGAASSYRKKRNAVAWAMFYGSTSGGSKGIEVMWNRPRDNRQLKTQFSVNIIGGSTPSGSSGSSDHEGGGGGHSF